MKWRSLEESAPGSDTRSLREIFAERKHLIAKYVLPETQAVHAKTGAFPVEVTFSPLKTDEGSICICAIRDITERKKVEENIRLLNANLEHKVAERTRELMEDVQERKRTEQALRESEQRLRVAIDAAQMGVWNLDLKTRTMTVSDRMARLQGVTAALSEALTVEQVAEAIVTHGMAALDANVAVVAMLTEDGSEFVNLRVMGYPSEVAEGWTRFPADAPRPINTWTIVNCHNAVEKPAPR